MASGESVAFSEVTYVVSGVGAAEGQDFRAGRRWVAA